MIGADLWPCAARASPNDIPRWCTAALAIDVAPRDIAIERSLCVVDTAKLEAHATAVLEPHGHPAPRSPLRRSQPTEHAWVHCHIGADARPGDRREHRDVQRREHVVASAGAV